MKHVKPVFDKIIVKPIQKEEVTDSGIYIPETVSDTGQEQQGVVAALGTGQRNGKTYQFTLKVGDKVLFKKYSPVEFVLDDETYYSMSESDILAIIEEK